MKTFLILQQHNKVIGAIFYDEDEQYVAHHLENCGCSARSYAETLVGLSMGQVLARLKVTGAIQALPVGYVNSVEEAINTVIKPLSSNG